MACCEVLIKRKHSVPRRSENATSTHVAALLTTENLSSITATTYWLISIPQAWTCTVCSSQPSAATTMLVMGSTACQLPWSVSFSSSCTAPWSRDRDSEAPDWKPNFTKMV